MKTIDVWLMIVLFSLSPHRKQVENLLKKKISSSIITINLMKNGIAKHISALREYFSVFLELAGSLLRSADSSISSFSVYLYYFLFVYFEESFQRQEVLGALITHIGSSVVCFPSSPCFYCLIK